MPSKYGKEFAVPKEFPSVLKAFTRECLRSQPTNIYEFGAEYFTQLQAEREAALAGDTDGIRRLTKEELEQLLSQMFTEADTDGSGALSLKEFKSILSMADLNLSEREQKRLLGEADINGDGEISYQEFVPMAVDMIHAMYARMEAEAARAKADEEAREEAESFLVHGMTKDEVEAIMGDIFKKSDADGSGQLSIAEFHKCCKDADIGLSRKEINILMHQCDADGNGEISYEEFVPLCYEMLVEIMKNELLMERRSGDDLCMFLQDIWRQADVSGHGTLDAHELKRALVAADLGLNKVQLHSVLAETDGMWDADGFLDYMAFAPKASDLIYRMLDPEAQMERYNQVNALGNVSFDQVHGYDQEQVSQLLMAEFDQAAGGAGVISQAAARAVLQSSKLGLSEGEIASVISSADVDPSGNIDYLVLAQYAFYILQYLAQNAAVYA